MSSEYSSSELSTYLKQIQDQKAWRRRNQLIDVVLYLPGVVGAYGRNLTKYQPNLDAWQEKTSLFRCHFLSWSNYLCYFELNAVSYPL